MIACGDSWVQLFDRGMSERNGGWNICMRMHLLAASCMEYVVIIGYCDNQIL